MKYHSLMLDVLPMPRERNNLRGSTQTLQFSLEVSTTQFFYLHRRLTHSTRFMLKEIIGIKKLSRFFAICYMLFLWLFLVDL